jgi:hypothetical protein
VTGRRPGEWPDEQGEMHLKVTAARARFQVVLGSIRADLEEQPSEATLRAAQRRWQSAVSQIADELSRQLRRNTG